MEADFKENDIRNAYDYLKKLRQGFKPRTTLCKDKSGQIISDTQNIKNTWKQYFQTLLGAQTDNSNNHDLRHQEEQHSCVILNKSENNTRIKTGRRPGPHAI